MIHTILSRIGCFFLLILLQALLFNHIHILGYATPLPYVYFLMILPNTTPRWVHILTGFGLGMAIDLFTGTPGMAASALCATGLLTTPLLKAFSPSDHEDDTFLPSMRTMEKAGFLEFAFCLTLIHCTLFFGIEAFSFFDWQKLLINIGGSTLLTLLVIIAFESVRNQKAKR